MLDDLAISLQKMPDKMVDKGFCPVALDVPVSAPVLPGCHHGTDRVS